jgi:RNA polymerase sigma-70 factor, ECF subfamily
VVVAEIEDAVRDAYARGRKRWPGVGIALEAFASHVHSHGISPERIEVRAEDLYLAAACGKGDREAQNVFASAVIDGARRSIRRYGNEDFVDEVAQRLRVHLLVAEDGAQPRVSRYDGRASLRSWVGICAVRMALYLLRGERNRRELTVDWSEALADVSTGDPAVDAIKDRYAHAFRDSLTAASRALSARQRTILKLRFAHGVSVDEIAATYAVHRVTAWRWLQGAQQALLDRALTELKVSIPDDDLGLRSLIGLVRSRIEISLAGLFEDEAGGVEAEPL